MSSIRAHLEGSPDEIWSPSGRIAELVPMLSRTNGNIGAIAIPSREVDKQTLEIDISGLGSARFSKI